MFCNHPLNSGENYGLDFYEIFGYKKNKSRKNEKVGFVDFD